VIEKHQTPWLSRWTMHTFEVKEDNARHLADLLGESLSQKNGGEWYADFKNETHHYIVFRGKIFFVDRRQKEEYEEAKNHGISIGMPDYQCDFDGSVAELALAAISIFRLRQIRQSSAYFKPSMPPLFSFGSREI